ncbi:MAG: AarF/UbiB family protein [Verrucomicrobiota bacterium]
MREQTSIPKHKIARAASLAGTGVRIGGNYVKHIAKKAVGAQPSREDLDAANARDSYDTFSKLKGGPLKVAQLLSIDRNLIPKAYRDQFQQAQYSAPPLSFPLVVQSFKREFAKHPDEIFDNFTRNAVNAASIGQVHQAEKDGKTYAVKVQYPGVAESLKSDIRLVKPFATRIFDLTPADVEKYFVEMEARLLEETDYNLELKRSVKLSEDSAHLPHTRFPKYYPEYSSSKVIAMDWIEGDMLDRFSETEKDSSVVNRVGQALWDFYHFQVHTLRVFHADPHPGNFIVKDGELWVIDFGCVKEIPNDYYYDYFQLLDRERLYNDSVFEEQLRKLDLIFDKDTANDRQKLISIFRESIELLGRPFHSEVFDFSDPRYMEEIAAFSEKTSNDAEWKLLSSGRGNPHALYINRAYFGLYNIMANMNVKIRAELPEWIQKESGAALGS